jgi:V/A-type H+-transporting ATPase subunit I
LGVASLSKVTVIAPRSDYQEVVRRLAQFKEFNPLEDNKSKFDPAVQELAVRAVRLYALADEAVKDLSIPLAPGTLDVVLRGVKVSKEEFDARDWNDLLTRAEGQLEPIAEKVRAGKAELSEAAKEENDSRALRDALEAVSGFSVDLGSFFRLKRAKAVLAVLDTEKLQEFKESLSGFFVVSQTLSETQSLVLIVCSAAESERVAKTMKALEVKPLVLPEALPQNPAEAYRKSAEGYQEARRRRVKAEAALHELRVEHQDKLLSLRELSELARNILDDARTAGNLRRIAVISGYIPSRRNEDFEHSFGQWMTFCEPVGAHGEDSRTAPTLMENLRPFKPFETITKEQGTPGGDEVDPTPLISFVFPAFFGIMFGDLGHGLVLTLFALVIRRRGTGNLRQWGNIFLAAGISASVVGVVVGEFFGFPLYQSLHIPGSALLDIVRRPLGSQATLNPAGITVALEIAILIGVAHLTTALGLDVVQAVKGHETVELVTEKLPALTMYVSGVGFGLSFIGAGFSFDVFKNSGPAPLLGVPNSLLGGVSLAIVLASMLALFAGKGIAIMTGKLRKGSAGSAFGNGAMEVFERISSYLANTISYVRLAIMLMIHAALLLAVNMLLAFPIYIAVVPVVIFNVLIIAFEVVIVYIQDLRLHVYEFFTKFYTGTGTPFRKILPDGVRIKIRWI